MKGTQGYISLLLTAVIIVLLFKLCSNKPPAVHSKDTLTPKIQQAEKAKDSAHIQVVHDSIEVIKWRTKYRDVRHDSITPCEEKLIICDTVLIKDSNAIASLHSELSFANLIIGLQDLRHERDSTAISDTAKYFRKQVRKQKLQKWLIALGWAAREGSQIIKP